MHEHKRLGRGTELATLAEQLQLPEQRAMLLAMAWHTGTRNVAELARLADVSRETVYGDLAAQGIDKADRKAATVPPPGAAADLRRRAPGGQPGASAVPARDARR